MQQRLFRTLKVLMLLVTTIALPELFAICFLSYNQPFEERELCTLNYSPSGFARQNMVAKQVVCAIDSEGRAWKDSVMYRINRYGFRGDDWWIDSSATRIVIVGGSHVFDIGAHDGTGAKPWPSILESELRRERANVQIFNMGVPGASTPEIVARVLYDVPFLCPHFVILNSTWNDLKWIVRFSHSLSLLEPGAVRPNPFVEKVNILDNLLGWSVVYRKLRDAYYRYQYNIHNTIGPIENLGQTSSSATKQNVVSGLRQYELNLRAFVNIVRSIGAEPVLAIEERLVHPNNTSQQKKRIRYDFIGPNITHEHLVDLFAACDSVIRQVSTQLDVPVIDANHMLQSNAEVFFSDHFHTTPEGSKALAAQYSNLLGGVVQSRQSNSDGGNLLIDSLNSAMKTHRAKL